MRNNKGQSGLVFIILIPIFFIIVAFLYDNILIITTNKAYREISESIITDVLTNSYYDKAEQVKNLYEKNKMEIEQLNAQYDGEYLTVYNVHTYPSFFGVAIGVKSYRTEVNLIAYKNSEDKIIIEDNNSEE